ncbi:MAG: hypothetical protein L6277_16745 [Desulfobacterales bacterium]|nr:hypothetical protein [Desulfobacterales bacterium]
MKKIKGWDQGAWWLSLAVLTALCLFSGCGGSDLQFSSEYQAVFLDNGQVFFGKVSDTGAPYLTLRDVYYVQTLVEKEQKKTANVLVKRGSEWHNPDFMRINTKHVVVIEPVGPDSRVAQLIKEAKAAPAPKAETPPPAPAPKAESPAPAPAPTPAPAPNPSRKRR